MIDNNRDIESRNIFFYHIQKTAPVAPVPDEWSNPLDTLEDPLMMKDPLGDDDVGGAASDDDDDDLPDIMSFCSTVFDPADSSTSVY